MTANKSKLDAVCCAKPAILAVLMAVLPAFWAVAAAAEVTMRDVPMTGIEITGGSGASAWRLRYGTRLAMRTPHEIVPAGDQVYFFHGLWLRQIDAHRGVVTGRWRFPLQIARITPDRGKLSVEIAASPDITRTFRHTVVLDPKSPSIPDWNPRDFGRGYSLQIMGGYSLPMTEATAPWRLALSGQDHAISINVAPDQARAVLPEVQNMVERDPLSPWFRVTYATLLKALGDPRAAGLFREAASIPSSDFTELLRISDLLAELGEKELAREAFERGYRDFWARGNDPRLLNSIWVRRTLFPVPSKPDAEWMERAWRLGPATQDAAVAWADYAAELKTAGQRDRAEMWQNRAAESRRIDPLAAFQTYQRVAWAALLMTIVLPAGALLVYLFVLYFRYRPQRDYDRRTGAGWHSRPFATLFHLEYADRRERGVLLGLVAIAWISAGVAGTLVETGERLCIWAGSLAGPPNTAYIESLLPSPERDLVLAVAWQQGGDNGKAERLYRTLPDFAESWNNLGVLLNNAGKQQDARMAFERALQMDPQLQEAALNLRGKAGDFWTAEYARMFPGRPMLAVPRASRMTRALLGRPAAAIYLRGLLGPLGVGSTGSNFLARLGKPEIGRRLLVMLSLAIALLFAFPRYCVSVPPGRGSRIAEMIIPGTSRAWLFLGGAAGALVYAAAILLLSLFVLTFQDPQGISMVFEGQFASSLQFSYGVTTHAGVRVRAWLAAGLAVLFALNFAVVWRSWRRGQSLAGRPAAT